MMYPMTFGGGHTVRAIGSRKQKALRMIILAHRGWWLTPDEKNTLTAFGRAFAAGYGAEVDVRDLAGDLVIAHDPPTDPGALRFEKLIDLYRAAGCPGELAINVKADGLQARLFEVLSSRRISTAFVFDMAVPDSLGYLARGFQTFTRESEIEPTPPFYDRAHGVWMDCFESDWITAAAVRRHREAGKRVALVSPELHRRPHQGAWSMWAAAANDRGVMLCTDFPEDADQALNSMSSHDPN